MCATFVEDPALAAYERLAPFYDLYTESYDYERWLSKLEALALEHGLAGKRHLAGDGGEGARDRRRPCPGARGGHARPAAAWRLRPGHVPRRRAQLRPVRGRALRVGGRDGREPPPGRAPAVRPQHRRQLSPAVRARLRAGERGSLLLLAGRGRAGRRAGRGPQRSGGGVRSRRRRVLAEAL